MYSLLKKDIEVVDVATPLTTERYTGNWKGSIEGWIFTDETMKTMSGKWGQLIFFNLYSCICEKYKWELTPFK